MDDIEDLGVDAPAHSPSRTNTRGGSVLPKALRTHHCPDRVAGTNIPGVGSVYVKTWGCAHNTSDGEYMAGLLAEYGYNITPDPLSADLWLLNSCTVKGPSEDALLNAVRRGCELGRRVVVAGCVPQGQRDHPQLVGVSVVGVQQIDRVVEVVEETLQGHTVRLLGNRKVTGVRQGGAPLSLPKIRRNPLVEIIAVNTGCLNHCTYCKTKHARGSLSSYPAEQIVQRAKQAFSEGVVEVWLTSEDLGAYGKDIGTSLPELLWQLIPIIPESCMMRLGMTNPPYIMEHIEEMVAILSHPRVYSFLHVPVQSASNAVLEDMKREYSVEDFQHLVDVLRQKVPNITIATDIICGFPTETTSDFAQTLALVQHYQFPSLFINQFYPRPGTPAARLKRLPTQEVKRRSRELTTLFHSYQPYHRRLGQTMEVLVTEVSHDRQFLVGHNKSYEQVLVAKDEGLLGKWVTVKVFEVGKHFMKGQEYDDSKPCPHGAGLNTWEGLRLQWVWVGVLITILSILLFLPP